MWHFIRHRDAQPLYAQCLAVRWVRVRDNVWIELYCQAGLCSLIEDNRTEALFTPFSAGGPYEGGVVLCTRSAGFLGPVFDGY